MWANAKIASRVVLLARCGTFRVASDLPDRSIESAGSGMKKKSIDAFVRVEK
jgi:hypothetical protein